MIYNYDIMLVIMIKILNATHEAVKQLKVFYCLVM